jgi:hypothetical protein
MEMHVHRLDEASKRLLLLASRGAWTDVQRERAVALVADVSDWNAVCEVAIRSFGACLAYRLLSTLDAGSVPAPVLERMQHVSRLVAVRSLQIESAMLAFSSGCLEPLGVRHAFFKGSALAHRYHAAPAARPSRDVDVLVDPALVLDVVRRARQAGYAPIRPIGPTDRDLVRWMKQETVYGMRGPHGVLVEIHHSLDHGDGVLDSGRMLERAEIIDFRGRALPVLRTADLFVYMCMHHTRHFWSHLHWYADLDAITAHPLFDIAEVREVAAGVRLGSTIEACLQLHEFAKSADWPASLSLEAGAGEALLARSVECLEGGPAREVELRATRLSPDRAFAWQSSMRERAVLFVLRVRRRLMKQFRRITGGVVRRVRDGFKRVGDSNGNEGRRL